MFPVWYRIMVISNDHYSPRSVPSAHSIMTELTHRRSCFPRGASPSPGSSGGWSWRRRLPLGTHSGCAAGCPARPAAPADSPPRARHSGPSPRPRHRPARSAPGAAGSRRPAAAGSPGPPGDRRAAARSPAGWRSSGAAAPWRPRSRRRRLHSDWKHTQHKIIWSQHGHDEHIHTNAQPEQDVLGHGIQTHKKNENGK